MSIGRYLALFAVAFLLSLLVTAPAWLLGDRIKLPPDSALAPLEGTLWSGRAAWLRVDGYQVESLQWRISPVGLLSGNPLLVTAQRPVDLRARLGLSLSGGVSVEALEASSPATTLLDYLSLPRLGVDAHVALRIDEAAFSGDRCESLSGILTVENWRGDLQGVESVGPLAGRLGCEGARMTLDVDPDNAVNLSGKFTLFTDGRYSIDLRAAPPRGPLYDSFEQLFGPPRDGRQFILRTRS